MKVSNISNYTHSAFSFSVANNQSSASSTLPNGTLQLQIPDFQKGFIGKNSTPSVSKLNAFQVFQRKLFLKYLEYSHTCAAVLDQIILSTKSFLGIENDIEKLIGKKAFREIKELNQFLLIGNGGDACFIAASLNALRLYKSLNPQIPVKTNADFMNYEKSFKWAINTLISNREYGYYFKNYAQDDLPYLLDFETEELGGILSTLAPNLLLEKAIGGNYNNYSLAFSQKLIPPKELIADNIPINLNGHFIDCDSLAKTIKALEKGSVGVLNMIPFSDDSSDGHDLALVKFIRGKNFNKVIYEIENSKKNTLSEKEMEGLGYFIMHEQNTNGFLLYSVEKLLNQKDLVRVHLISPPSKYQVHKLKPDKNVSQEIVNAQYLSTRYQDKNSL